MSEPDLKFTIIAVQPQERAATPTLAFRLRIEDASRTPVHTILLRTQLQIQPRRRGHTQDEKDRLLDLFGEPERWSGTLRALPWTQTTLVVPAFEGQIEVDLLAPCTYDFEVVAAKYLEALEGGDV
ncbi:MAG TPA: DUF6084 family protein, partial [Bryobacteraceae bacterium]|nr:DUF6084 family protein [Bryobacteraceae bacterium]